MRYVNPAYTSWIGQLKYGQSQKLSRHQAAAWVIARRVAGYAERLPKSVIAALPVVAVAVEQTTWLKPKVKTEWLNRLNDWKEYSPLKGRPWLL